MRAQAMFLVDKLRAELEYGKAARLVQTTPHVVLLSRPFYHTKLKPLLARWARLPQGPAQEHRPLVPCML